MNPQHRPIHILIAEDNPADAELAMIALQESRIANSFDIVNDGEAVIDYLRKQAGYEHKKRPDLMLLDINLPRKSGFEILEEVKQDAELKAIPVVMLTSSSSEEDILRSYQNYASCYITKPIEFTAFMEVIRSIEQFWVSIVKLPEPHVEGS